MRARVICDGRGNAGTGARAAVLFQEGDEPREKAERLDPTTNIVAEHRSIQLGIELALEHGVTDLEIVNDSRTPVLQLRRECQVRAEHLKPIVAQTWDMLSRLDNVVITRVPRSETKVADALCRAVDPSPRAA